ncbi:hypothetical protein KMI_01g01640 [Encephalitozoon hellem]|nr:hypothetical protein KMI_01g01640 [Encephalitozoon hellem]
MELLREFLEEWRDAVAAMKKRVMCEGIEGRSWCMGGVSGKAMVCPKEVSGSMDKENDEGFCCDEDFEGAFDQESLIPGHIPIIKSRDVAVEDPSSPSAKKDAKDPRPMSSGTDVSRENSHGYKEVVFKEEPNAVDLRTLEPYRGTKLRNPSVIKDPAEGKDGTELPLKDAGAVRDAEEALAENTGKDNKSLSANAKLNAALMQLKKRCLNKVDESVCAKDEKESAMGLHRVEPQPFGVKSQEPESMKRFNGSNLYKQAIDYQLLRSAGKVPQHVYKPKTKIPRVDEDDVILDPDFVVPDFAKDPAINFKVKMQDHRVLERYFSNGHEIDVERLFPHVKNVSNNSPNKWPTKSSGE